MNREFQKALEKKRIVPFENARPLIAKELKEAGSDLAEAQDRLKHKKYKYATITAYYSMFHAARALLYSKKYREKSHYYLLVAMQALFMEKGSLSEELVGIFHDCYGFKRGS